MRLQNSGLIGRMPHFRLRSSPLGLLLIAGAFHVLFALAVFLVGHFELLPNTIDTHGIGITFSIDGLSYRGQAIDLAETLRNSGISAWFAAPSPFHCRLYSLPFAMTGSFLGYNILAAEPLNMLYYLGILSLVYLLGKEIFNPRAALIAASIVALWPSLLLHSVQLIRDPLSIFCLLGLLFVATLLLGRDFSWKHGIAIGICGVLLTGTFWLARANMWNVVIAMLAITLPLLAIRMVRERRFLIGNLLALVFLIVAAVFIPSRIESTTLPGIAPATSAFTLSSASQPDSTTDMWSHLIRQITRRRSGFKRSYLVNGSNIDAQVSLNNATDVLKYLPRATVIGLFAPFPNMWLHKAGQAGTAARILSGFEMSLMYLLYVPMAVCVWQKRRRQRMWLTFLVALTSLMALGLVVVNAGALYRLRYAFWIMLIIIAAEGLLILKSGLTNRKAQELRKKVVS